MQHQVGLSLLEQAVNLRATDIYLLPRPNKYAVAFKVAQQTVLGEGLGRPSGEQVINAFKYAADMAVSETRRPQTGALRLSIAQQSLDLRLSSVGDYLDRESLVIRLLYPFQADQAHFLIPQQLDTLLSLAQQRGLMLFVGPTGSGKTTTMYQVAEQLSPDRTVMTIEDPVELVHDQFLQLQVNVAANMSYASLLKVGLRHRPDILIIGEVRDTETAQVAVEAALSGHLVLATIHARSAPGAVTRLRELGVSKSYLTASLTAVSYLRLLPTLSGHSGVLMDTVTSTNLYESSSMSKGWGQHLAQLVNSQTISQMVADQSLAG